MKNWLPIEMVCWLALGVQAGVPTNAPASIELPDQFEQPQKLSFSNTNLTGLTLADHKGSKQLAGGIEPVIKRFGPRVAVRAGFRKEQSYPVMLDWSGAVVNSFHRRRIRPTFWSLTGREKSCGASWGWRNRWKFRNSANCWMNFCRPRRSPS